MCKSEKRLIYPLFFADLYKKGALMPHIFGGIILSNFVILPCLISAIRKTKGVNNAEMYICHTFAAWNRRKVPRFNWRTELKRY